MDYGDDEIYVKFVPWPEAVKIYKQLDKEYDEHLKLMKDLAKKVFEDKDYKDDDDDGI